MENSIVKLLREKIEKIKNSNERNDEQKKKIDYYSKMIIDDTKSINLEEFCKFVMDIGINLSDEEIKQLDALVYLANGIGLGYKIDEFLPEQLTFLTQLRDNVVLQGNMLTNISFKKYEDLFSKLTNFKNSEFVIEFDIITDLLKESNLSDLDKMNVWKSLILFNQKVYNNQVNGNEITDVDNIEYTDIDKDKLCELLNGYNIDFNCFDEQGKELLLMFGNLDNIGSILKCLSNNGLLIKNDKVVIDDVKLVNLFIYSNEFIINDVFTNANEVGIKKERILELINVFIGKRRNGEGISRKYFARTNKNLGEKYGIRISGSYENYIENLELFDKYGIDAKVIASKCLFILGSSSITIKKNLNLFNLYRIKLDIPVDNSKTGVAASSICRVNLFDNIDHMIEFGAEDVRNMGYSPLVSRDSEFVLQVYNTVKNGNQAFRFFNKTNRVCFAINSITSSVNNSCLNKEDEPYEFDFEYKKDMDRVVNYLANDSIRKDIFSDDNINYLERNNIANDYTYRINGVLISRYKVLRIYSSLKDKNISNENALLYAVTYNSLLSKDDFNKVNDGLSNAIERRLS